jgi:protoheme IX farnesyltransferase
MMLAAGPAKAMARPMASCEAVQRGGSELRDFWMLLKPGVMQLVVFTAGVALYLAPGALHPVLGFTTILCIAMGAGAAAAINNWFDLDIDGRMTRTRLRPTAAGRIEPAEALALGIALSIISVMTLGLAVSWLAAGLLAFTIFFYVVIYTMWLKRRSAQNIVIGGAAGAFPPIVAWAAATGRIDLLPLILFLIIFLWTPPHFWALALCRTGDYARAGVPMLPVVAGPAATRRQILTYAAILVPVALLPTLLGHLGWIYGLAAAALGLTFLAYTCRLWRTGSDIMAMQTFRFSLAHLFVLFLFMAIDRAVADGWTP